MDSTTIAFHPVVSDFGCYLLVALFLALGVRLLLVLLKAYEVVSEEKGVAFWRAAARMYSGRGATRPATDSKVDDRDGRGDYLAPLVLGWLELLTFPVLLRGGYWVYIGAWVGLKTLAQYRKWESNRSMFNRFLIGTALVLILAYVILLPYVGLAEPLPK